MSETGTRAPSIDPAALYRRIARGEAVSLLDLRDRDEFEAWRITGEGVRAEQVPHVRFLAAAATGDATDPLPDLDEPVIAVCGRGEASDHVAGLLREAGIDAVNLAGGMEAWARLYVEADLTPAVRQYHRPSSGCLSYLIHGGGEAVVVDPLRAFADRYREDAAALGVDVTRAVDTHVHADHLSGLRAVADRTGAEPVLPAGTRDRGLAFDAAVLADGDTIEVGGVGIEAIHAPGHTSEMTALLADGVLLSGDSLFLDSVARPDLERGDEGARELAEVLHDTLHGRLLGLDDGTLVAPGHVSRGSRPNDGGGYAAPLAEVCERVNLLGLDRAAFVERVAGDLPPRPANHEAIIAANLGREAVEGEEAFELELGPNNCAV